MSDLARRLGALKLDLAARRGRRDVVRATIERDERLIQERTVDADDAHKASEVVMSAIEARRLELKDRVESLVNKGLRAVFARSDLEFFFRTVLRGPVLGIIPALRSSFGDKVVELDIVDGHGGGVADVVSFLLRVVVLILARPKLAPFLVLDEPFRHVSQEYLRGCANLLRELNRSVGIQFIVVTHKPDLLDAADVVWRAQIDGGRTSFVLEHDDRDDRFHQRAAGIIEEAASPRESAPIHKLVGTDAHVKVRPQVVVPPLVTPVDENLTPEQQIRRARRQARRLRLEKRLKWGRGGAES